MHAGSSGKPRHVKTNNKKEIFPLRLGGGQLFFWLLYRSRFLCEKFFNRLKHTVN